MTRGELRKLQLNKDEKQHDEMKKISEALSLEQHKKKLIKERESSS